MTKAPLISVIMPAHDCEPLITAAIGSVQAQTEPNFELIVVENGSTDGTADVVKALAHDDSRVHLIQTATPLFPSAARNVGLRAARGEWISFLDADDVWHPDRLRIQILAGAVAGEKGQALVFSDFKRFESQIDENPQGILVERQFLRKAAEHVAECTEIQHVGTVYVLRRSIYNFLSTEWSAISTNAISFPRSLLLAQREWFREDFYVNEDLELWFRLIDKSLIVYVPQVLSYYRYRAGSVTSDDSAFQEGMVKLHAGNYAAQVGRFTPTERSKYRHRIAGFLFALGWARQNKGDLAGARAAYLRSLRFRTALGPALAWSKTYIPAPLRRVLRSLLRAIRKSSGA